MYKTTLNIDQIDSQLHQYHNRWAKNRAFVAGEEAVKRRGAAFLPGVRADDSSVEYQAHLDRTSFYPAVNKIHQGLLGLVFRKRSQLNSTSARVQLLSELISANNQSLEELAEELLSETLITNFTGLLVDHPSADQFTNLTAANADQLGFRPQLALYVAESILEVRWGLVNNQRAPTYVRLQEAEGQQVRELLLDNQGIDRVNTYVCDANRVFPASPRTTTPLINGQPLREIPFVIVSTTDKTSPQPSALQQCVDLNLQHFRVEGLMTSAMFFTAGPTIVVNGFEAAQDDQGNPLETRWDVSAGAVWVLPPLSRDLHQTTVDFLQYDPKGAELLTNKLRDIKDSLSTNGFGILTPEKPAPEAPETLVQRRAAESAALAAMTRKISSKLERALRWFAMWVDGSQVSFALNTDFAPAAMSTQEITVMMNLWQAGAITHETLLLALRDGEIVSATLDPQTEIQAAQSGLLDRPAVDA